MTDAHDALPSDGEGASDEQGPGTDDGRGALRMGAVLFDGGEPHAAHEVFEERWLAAKRTGRRAEAAWWQGLVLCAGAVHHARRGNAKGASALGARAARRLAACLEEADAETDTETGATPERPWWRAAAARWLAAWRATDLDAVRAGAAGPPRLGALLDGTDAGT